MSNWTYVEGEIGVDYLAIDGEDKPLDFDEIIGKELHPGDHKEKWYDARKHPEKYLPFGDEGSLVRNVRVNTDTSCATTYSITVFGYLRAHDNTDKIIDWFKEKCGKLCAQNANITVADGLQGIKNWTLGR